MEEIIKQHKQKGLTFFDEDVMKLFGSKIESEVYKGKYFITSESTGVMKEKRKFTIRKFEKETGHIVVAHEKHCYDNLNEAMQQIEKLR